MRQRSPPHEEDESLAEKLTEGEEISPAHCSKHASQHGISGSRGAPASWSIGYVACATNRMAISVANSGISMSPETHRRRGT